jgi:hypothetical protein
MSTTRKVAVGLGIASVGLLAAWLLTGSRKNKTKEFIRRQAQNLKSRLSKPAAADETDTHYI